MKDIDLFRETYSGNNGRHNLSIPDYLWGCTTSSFLNDGWDLHTSFEGKPLSSQIKHHIFILPSSKYEFKYSVDVYNPNKIFFMNGEIVKQIKDRMKMIYDYYSCADRGLRRLEYRTNYYTISRDAYQRRVTVSSEIYDYRGDVTPEAFQSLYSEAVEKLNTTSWISASIENIGVDIRKEIYFKREVVGYRKWFTCTLYELKSNMTSSLITDIPETMTETTENCYLQYKYTNDGLINPEYHKDWEMSTDMCNLLGITSPKYLLPSAHIGYNYYVDKVKLYPQNITQEELFKTLLGGKFPYFVSAIDYDYASYLASRLTYPELPSGSEKYSIFGNFHLSIPNGFYDFNCPSGYAFGKNNINIYNNEENLE